MTEVLRCISSCSTERVGINPLTLRYLLNPGNPYCAVTPHDKDGLRGEMMICTNPVDSIHTKEMELNLLNPEIDFNCKLFLYVCYNIRSFESALEWIDTHHVPLLTKERIMNCTWEIYADELQMIDTRLINFYSEMIRLWESEYRKSLMKFKTKKRSIDYLVDRYLNKKYVYKFFESFIKSKKNYNIKQLFLEYIEGKIKLSTK